jgi:hypothetical protein
VFRVLISAILVVTALVLAVDSIGGIVDLG